MANRRPPNRPPRVVNRDVTYITPDQLAEVEKRITDHFTAVMSAFSVRLYMTETAMQQVIHDIYGADEEPGTDEPCEDCDKDRELHDNATGMLPDAEEDPDAKWAREEAARMRAQAEADWEGEGGR